MKKALLILQIIIIVLPADLVSQSHYEVARAAFSSKKYDEFCPVVYRDQIVFCSNRELELLISYQNRQKMGLFNIFMVNIKPDSTQQGPEIFSQNLVTPFNDGPAAFSPDSSQLVYSRNMDIAAKKKNIVDLSNNLGLYFAELIDGEWIPEGDFPFNNPDYSITTPCYSRDGQFLYFGSDMPGGYGGTDIYRSARSEGEWSEPINLGEEVNTAGNEVYPFIAANGDLFFASDGHGGLGKKDIFLTRMSNSDWITPVPLTAPINSTEDDFGLITDGEFSEGFFSSNRDKTDDIYRFSTLVPQLINCDTLIENIHCFEFWDEEYIGMDSLPVTYEWEFSDGTKLSGISVEHCLPGAGEYWAKLNIIDNSTSNTFFTQTSMEFELEDHIQPFITSKEAGLINSNMEFSGLHSYLPGYYIEEYVWDFGDGTYATGPEIEHQFKMTGEYGVKLGLTGYAEGSPNKETRCVIKSITVVNDNQTLAMQLSGIKSLITAGQERSDIDSSKAKYDFSVFDFDPGSEVFRVEVLASEDQILLTDSLFDPLRNQYEIKEFYLSGTSLYSYTVGEYNSLLASYNEFSDVVSKGFASAQVKTYVLAELPTEVIKRITQDFAKIADANFEFNQSKVAQESYPILDKVVAIMEENPDLMLEIAAHTDNIGSFEFNLELSRKRAQSIVDYIVSNGVDRIRLKGNGYGESRPIAPNNTEEGRMMNRRVEFFILNE